jgi:hypothetical protein
LQRLPFQDCVERLVSDIVRARAQRFHGLWHSRLTG